MHGATGTATLAIAIDAPYDEAFAYLADPRRIPEWATNFVRAVREHEGTLVAATPFGEAPIRILADHDTGVVDQVLGETVYPARVLRNGDGVDYVFTLRRPERVPDAAWETAALPGLREELENLKRVLEADRERAGAQPDDDDAG